MSKYITVELVNFNCLHNNGFTMLKKHYGLNNKKLACNDGCGFILSNEVNNMKYKHALLYMSGGDNK